MARTAVGVLIGIVFLGSVIYLALSHSGVECEVCIEFEGRRLCESAGAADRNLAQMQATSSACRQLAGGVTRGMRCTSTPPLSVRCSE